MNPKDIDIKNRTYYFFNDIINIKDFDPDNIKIHESYKNILIYYIGYVAIKKDLKIYGVILCTLFLVMWMNTLKKLIFHENNKYYPQAFFRWMSA